jgi:hypothetical protein
MKKFIKFLEVIGIIWLIIGFKIDDDNLILTSCLISIGANKGYIRLLELKNKEKKC